MKNLIGIVVLAVICVGLAVVLFTTKNRYQVQKEKDTDTIVSLSNYWERTQADLEEQKQVNQSLEADLARREEKLTVLTNELTSVSSTLAKTEVTLKAANADLARMESHIAGLEDQNAALDQQAITLNQAITNLTVEISDTQAKLASAEGDKAFLESELRRLMAEKAELEKKFNDLEILRAQVKQLKAELSIAQRLAWIRKGLLGDTPKGATMLISKPGSPRGGEQYDLNVEIKADGSVEVIKPLQNPPKSTY